MNDDPKIVVIGNGFIGQKEYKLFKNFYPTIVYDTSPERTGYIYKKKHYSGHELAKLTLKPFSQKIFNAIGAKEITKELVNKCKLGIICVNTKVNEDGSPDLTIVEEVLSWLNTDIILIKSSIPPGYTEKLSKRFNKRLVYSPEFVGTTKYGSPRSIFHSEADLREFPYFIFGGPPEVTTKLVDIYQTALGPEKSYIETSPKVAELVKFTTNSYFAMKLTTFSMFERECEGNYNRIRERFFKKYPLESRWHTSVFKKDPFESIPVEVTYGGICLPKDTMILDWLLIQNGEAGISDFFPKKRTDLT